MSKSRAALEIFGASDSARAPQTIGGTNYHSVMIALLETMPVLGSRQGVHHNTLTICSIIFLAAPNNIMVLSRRRHVLSIPEAPTAEP